MRYVLLAALAVGLALATRERTRRARRDDLVPHGFAESGPADRIGPGDEVVTVARLRRSEAAVAQGMLTSVGIPSIVHPDRVGPRDWQKPVRLQVRLADASDAKTLLDEVREGRPGPARG